MEISTEDGVRAAFAHALGTKVSEEDPNPWALPVTVELEDCGVGTGTARERVGEAVRGLGVDGSVRLDILPFCYVPLEQYETAISEKAARGGVIGLGFDYGFVAQLSGRAPILRRAHHLVRLTPLAGDRVTAPTINSESFDFGYRGDLQTFDDSGGLIGDEMVMRWQRLIDGVRRANGAIWCVERVAL